MRPKGTFCHKFRHNSFIFFKSLLLRNKGVNIQDLHTEVLLLYDIKSQYNLQILLTQGCLTSLQLSTLKLSSPCFGFPWKLSEIESISPIFCNIYYVAKASTTNWLAEIQFSRRFAREIESNSVVQGTRLMYRRAVFDVIILFL